ncbi:hypothetical protein H0H93_004240 [Arthromyces matolae]|nr:hypothetical protein H0H93_004240 [Arthromyces matolae]
MQLLLSVLFLAPLSFANPVELPGKDYHPISEEQKEAPWHLAALTANGVSINAMTLPEERPFYYRTIQGINIYMIGPPVDTDFDDIRGLVSRDDHWFKKAPRGDTNATYAVALAVGKNRGVAKGAHLEAISILPFKKTPGFAELKAGIEKILGACKNDKIICVAAIPYSFWDTEEGAITRPSGRQLSEGVIRVMPIDDQNHNSKNIPRQRGVFDIRVPVEDKIDGGNEPVDEMLAAVLRAAGVTASFVSWYWHESHKKPDPVFIKMKILEAGIMPASFGLRNVQVIHIPNQVSGRSGAKLAGNTLTTQASNEEPRHIGSQRTPGGAVQAN